MAETIRDELGNPTVQVSNWERYGFKGSLALTPSRRGIRRRSPRILEILLDPDRLGVIHLFHRLAYAPIEDHNAVEELLLLGGEAES